MVAAEGTSTFRESMKRFSCQQEVVTLFIRELASHNQNLGDLAIA